MKYVDEFRDQSLARQLATAIAHEAEPGQRYRLMEFCGGHTHAIFRYGVQGLMPKNVNFVHGPGCPVCVLPINRLELALQLACDEGVILCSYGDMMRVPAKDRRSLLQAKASGADVRMVYSPQDALVIARENPQQQVVLFAIGFETTTPPTAVVIKQAQAEQLDNFSVFCNHVLTPAALEAILNADQPLAIDAVLGPSHVSTIIGSEAYTDIAEQHRMPIVIAGFEPLDVMQSALMAVRMINAGRYGVENEYRRAVTATGNTKAQTLVAEVFDIRDSFEWRGLGELKHSALRIQPQYAAYDAEQRFALKLKKIADVKGCECPAVLRGQKSPPDCKLFGSVCTPENPLGACMVSSEGACAAHWHYGRHRALTA